MILARTRSLSLAVALMGCSTDTLVVAALDASAGEGGQPAASNDGGNGGDARGSGGGGGDDERGGSETARGGGGAGNSGTPDSASGSGGTGTSSAGGTGSVTELEGEITTSVCACVGSASFVCGTDGITYDPSCTSGCDQVVIACLHACPCDDATGEGGAPNSTEWIDERCFDPSLCPSGSLCFSSDGTVPSRSCGP